jgi:hypothetical protein
MYTRKSKPNGVLLKGEGLLERSLAETLSEEYLKYLGGE